MMTREDMLRELELLPVWRLRAPVPEVVATPVEAVAGAPTMPTETAVSVETVVSVEFATAIVAAVMPQVEAQVELGSASAASPVLVSYIESSDADWLFVLPASPLAADAALLLSNIFNAMRLKVSPVSTPVAIPDLNKTPKIMIALGEPVAQALLQTDASLQHLRGKLHQLSADIPLVATYEIAQLLADASYKPMLWADLCLAMQALKP